MGLALAALGISGPVAIQAAAASATASAAKPATALVFAPASLPEWLLLPLVLGLSLIGINILSAIKAHSKLIPKPKKDEPREFTQMLCDQVWRFTNHMNTVFAQRIRRQPRDVEDLRVHAMHLSEDLATALGFVEQMRAHPTDKWPSQPMLQAFTNWSGQIARIATLVSKLEQQVTFPLLREPVDKGRDTALIRQYMIEQQFLDRALDLLTGEAYQFCTAAKKQLEKKKDKKSNPYFGFGSSAHDDDEEDEAHKKCPCCNGADALHQDRRRDPIANFVFIEKEAPAPSPAPESKGCCCVPAQPCRCQRGCSCGCQCGHGSHKKD